MQRHHKSGKFNQKYVGESASVSADDIGVLCSWYDQDKDVHVKRTCIQSQIGSQTFIPVSAYICTVPDVCFESDKGSLVSHTKAVPLPGCRSTVTSSRLRVKAESYDLMMNFASQEKTLSSKEDQEMEKKRFWGTTQKTGSTEKVKGNIHTISRMKCGQKNVSLMKKESNLEVIELGSESDEDSKRCDQSWITIGRITLYEADIAILQSTDWLNGSHMNAVQHLIHVQFPNIKGL